MPSSRGASKKSVPRGWSVAARMACVGAGERGEGLVAGAGGGQGAGVHGGDPRAAAEAGRGAGEAFGVGEQLGGGGVLLGEERADALGRGDPGGEVVVVGFGGGEPADGEHAVGAVGLVQVERELPGDTGQDAEQGDRLPADGERLRP